MVAGNLITALVRKGALVGGAVVSLVVASACGAPSAAAEGELAADVVTVRPRVAIDGLIELSARTEGRLFVDEVVFHAPSVRIQNGPFAIADVLASDPDDAGALFFRYALVDGGGAGAVASERRWSLSPEGATPESQVTFGFSPFQPSDEELDEVLARTGWDLSALDGYTAYVHGYVSMQPYDPSVHDEKRSFGAHDRRKAGDAEGDPARVDTGDRAAGDAEGDPAEGTGERAAGDAEGDPAEGNGERAAGDAEGDPARTNDSGERLAGDAEGDPAHHKHAAFEGEAGDELARRPGERDMGADLVPFFLVFDSSVELGVSLAELGLAELEQDEFLPIDLRVDVNRLLTDERLADLDVEAAAMQQVEEGFATLEVSSSDARHAFAIDLDKVQKRDVRDADEHTLVISGDPRD